VRTPRLLLLIGRRPSAIKEWSASPGFCQICLEPISGIPA